MILFVLYLLVLSGLIYRNGFFKWFKDDKINNATLSFFFFIKASAVPVFYFVYKKMYGGVEYFDAGKFYHDAVIINQYAYSDFWSYLKLLFGFQNDEPGSGDYINCLVNTVNWDNGIVKDYLYNDNRIVIRLHSLFNFLAFDSYFVHALFNCFLSYVGIFFLYKSLKEFFNGKEIWVLVILCFFPALWFYTGAVLKEGLTLFFLGALALLAKKTINTGFTISRILLVILLILISFLLKPYILLFSSFCFALFFMLQKRDNLKNKILVFISILLLMFIAANILSLLIKQKSLLQAATKHQQIFSGVAKGGIFLTDSSKFLRLEYDTNLVKKQPNADSLYRIKTGAPYLFWKDNNAEDTLRCPANQDTTSIYKLVYKIAPSNSNIGSENFSNGFFTIVANCLYYSLFYPLLYNTKGLMQLLASFENVAILCALLYLLFSFFKQKKLPFLPFVLLTTCLCVCFLVSYSAPNSGAIFRYRSPVVVFIFLSVLYYWPDNRKA